MKRKPLEQLAYEAYHKTRGKASLWHQKNWYWRYKWKRAVKAAVRAHKRRAINGMANAASEARGLASPPVVGSQSKSKGG